MIDPKERAEAGEGEDLENDANEQTEGEGGEGGRESDTDADEDDSVDDESGEPGSDRGAEDDAGSDDGAPRQAPQVKPASRVERRIQALANEAKQAREDAAAARREVENYRQAQTGRQTAEQEAVEREKVSLMSPDEKLDYYRGKDRQELDRRFSMLQFQSADAADRSAFETLRNRNPAIEAVADEVEEVLARERRNGFSPNRETVAKYLIGEKALQRASRALPKQKRQGESKIARDKVRAPGGGRSDVGNQGTRGSEKQKRYDRIKDVQI